MFFQYQQRIGAGDIVLDGDIRDLEVVHLDSGAFLLASTGLNGGLVSYELAADGRVIGVSGEQYFSPDSGSQVSGTFDTIVNGNSAMVVMAGGMGTSMAQYGLSASGSLHGGPRPRRGAGRRRSRPPSWTAVLSFMWRLRITGASCDTPPTARRGKMSY
ncbi:hypothetical protein KDD17_14050 [Sulfitobacter albidus]|uniref:Uncharacterized protein n=1 Tax=Sulfitobacter albidus TaxID=2829501 RepID=A0A975JCP1_9RHOB|nr:hypothetical protein [Sulfitobacter albidus]QUJ76036.1 hypothetical protein KDD17_14050 [Sulfitobacter albidus]